MRVICDNLRGQIIGDEAGLLKLIFSRDDMRLPGGARRRRTSDRTRAHRSRRDDVQFGAELFNRTCFNYPTLGDLYKYATYEAILKQKGDDRGRKQVIGFCARWDARRVDLQPTGR